MNIQNTMGLAPHEALEIHELISCETTCLKKLQANISMVQDNELNQFMSDSLTAKKNALNNMQQFISQISIG